MFHVTSTDGTAIAVHESGRGAPLVLIHGSSSGSRRWLPILEILEGHFTVYRMERRGRGASGDGAAYAIVKEVEDILAVLRSIPGRLNVLAHSYGAICALEAAREADNIDRLILYEPPIPVNGPLHPPGTIARIQACIDAGDLEGAYCTFALEALKRPAQEIERLRRLPAWSVYLDMVPTLPREMAEVDEYRFDPERFRDLQTPTLLLTGGVSLPHFTEALDLLRSTLPVTRTVSLPGQEHIAMDTAPRLFVREVLRFLQPDVSTMNGK